MVTVHSSRDTVESHVLSADLVIGAVLVPGAAAPKLVSRQMVKEMKQGAVVVDIAIDQGGCFETSRPTTHADPTYVVDGVVHYCVANMPGAVPRTSTYALNNATLPFVLALADKGWKRALADDPHLRNGLNVARGKVTHHEVAAAVKASYFPAESSSADALVLGAGIVGVCVALHLQKRGRATVLVDRRGAAEETSFGNAGLVQREGVYPYGFPHDFGALLRYSFNRTIDAHYHPRRSRASRRSSGSTGSIRGPRGTARSRTSTRS